MNSKKGSESGMFMMEMILAVFFFIMCTTVCIQVFVSSNSMSEKATDTNKAVVAATGIIEIWKAEGEEGLQNYLHATIDEDYVQVYWDENWIPSQSESAFGFQGNVSIVKDGGLEKASVTIRKTSEEDALLQIETAKYSRDQME